MKRFALMASLVVGVVALNGNHAADAAILITEVDPLGSSASPYLKDWFELTNTGSNAVTIANWKMDDDHLGASGHGAPLAGVSSIAAGQSVVFVESSSTTQTTINTLIANFKSAWFDTNVPTGFTIGTYTGSGVGLGNGGDAVNIYDDTGALVAGVTYTSDGSNPATFDNSAGLDGALVSLRSVSGVNNAFNGANKSLFSKTVNEIGSPGAVPEPASLALVGMGVIASLRRRRN